MPIQKSTDKSSLVNLINKSNKLNVVKEDIFLTTWYVDKMDYFNDKETILLEFKEGDFLEFYAKPSKRADEFIVEVFRENKQIGFVLTLEILYSLLKAGKSLYGIISDVGINAFGNAEVEFKLFLKM